jgi:hypothetical protein
MFRQCAVEPETRATAFPPTPIAPSYGHVAGFGPVETRHCGTGGRIGVTPTLPPGWQVHDIAAGVRLRIVRAMPDLSAALDIEIDRLWTAAQARMGGKLFNGRVFSADVIAADQFAGHWTEFRRIVAQMLWNKRPARASRPMQRKPAENCGFPSCWRTMGDKWEW